MNLARDDAFGQPSTFVELAERRLRHDIVAGVLVPFDKLRMADLKTRYDMGASPLREALSRLVGERLVAFEGNKGFRVSGLSRADLADIAYMRTAIESYAIRTAIANGDAAWEGRIIAALHVLLASTRDTATDRTSLDAWNVAHDEFHEALLAGCGSPRVFEMQRRLAEQHNRYRRFLMGANLPRDAIVDEHRALAEAALARDADRAADLLGAHMLTTSSFYARVLAGEVQAARADVIKADAVA